MVILNEELMVKGKIPALIGKWTPAVHKNIPLH
jgi:hypothetical protein